jgi:hypothetical protein
MDITKTHDACIERLVADAHPVRRLWPPWTRLLVWIGLGIVVGGTVAIAGLRPDLASRSRDPMFLISLAGLATGAVLLARLALHAAVPGREPRGRETVLPIVLLAVATVLSLRGPVDAGLSIAQFAHMGFGCAVRTVLIALAPWLALLLALRRGAPLAPPAAGALAGAASFALACGIMQAACAKEDALHLVVWHGLPALGGVALSALVGYLVLRWRRRP